MKTEDLPSGVEELNDLSAAMQAISHPTRLKILGAIGSGEKIVTNILEEVGTTQSNVSQHVEVLRKAGIVQSRRVHNRVYCSVTSSDIFSVISRVKECFCSDREKGMPYRLVA